MQFIKYFCWTLEQQHMLVNELHNNDIPGRAGQGWVSPISRVLQFCHQWHQYINNYYSLVESLKVLIFHKLPVNEDVCGQESNVKD